MNEEVQTCKNHFKFIFYKRCTYSVCYKMNMVSDKTVPYTA